jgi:hypothetical protein
MARSTPNAAVAFPAEVARYLSVEPEDVQSMIRLEKLPAIKLPAKTRHVYRIPLRDFHRWLLTRTQNPAHALTHYETFLADFHTAASAV